MDALKKFFDKKKADTKFKLAGKGHSLARDEGRSPGHGSRQGPAQPRLQPTSDAQRAGAAALARFETSSKKTDVNWSLQAIKAQARRELEAEQKALESLRLESESSSSSSGPREVNLDAAPLLAVQGVYFHCPLIGSDVAPYDEVKQQIREFLYAQRAEDPGIAACLIIHTCNKNKEKVSVCVETLCKYIENIVSNPGEDKYRRIRASNKAYVERVQPLEGAGDFLEAAGFRLQQLPFNDATDNFWVFPEDGALYTLEQLRDALVSAEPVRPTLDRSLAVLLPAEAAAHTELPPDFFSLTPDELRREMQQRESAVERNMMLLTKAMRERQEMREMRKYRFSLIRVRFPDGLILQGTFGTYEKFSEVVKFVRENLTNDWRPFFLSLSGGGKVTEEDQNLVELRLVPAVMFNFTWDASVADPNLDDNVYLKEQTLMHLQHA